MKVPRELLPENQQNWHGFLRDYFCDKDATPTREDDHVDLKLAWPSAAERHVDPQLAMGLAQWGQGVTPPTMWSARWRDRKILTSLYDTWTLHSWSEWLARTSSDRARNVVILHVDDHRDLGSPRLIMCGGTFLDAITGEQVKLRDPASVYKAIESGAVGMGSFMTPFLHEVPGARVRHLCQPPKVRQTAQSRLTPISLPDTLLHPGARRPGIHLAPVAPGEPGDYLVTSDPKVWCRGIEDAVALVHIDMDYFNNRYDGDSAWQENRDRLDPELPRILAKIDELVDAIASSGAQIDDVTIAFSPGFFPAEYWHVADQRLRVGLEKLL